MKPNPQVISEVRSCAKDCAAPRSQKNSIFGFLCLQRIRQLRPNHAMNTGGPINMISLRKGAISEKPRAKQFKSNSTFFISKADLCF